jgi:trk system potassium uptake protein
MMSSFTTTGATIYETPGRLADSLHLWRALVGWLGGFFALLMAIAVLAPLNLGGAEVLAGRIAGVNGQSGGPASRIADPSERLTRNTLELFPTYAGLTCVLWVLLLIAGESGLTAVCHAMSTLSTSGISPGVVMGETGSGIVGEVLIAGFLIFALSRRTMPGSFLSASAIPLYRDPEIRMAFLVVASVTLVLFLRHWFGAIAQEEGADVPAFLRAIWGAAFTALSFLTTTGFVSSEWVSVQLWSGLQSPGLILLGLAIIGGGVATTAGGVKLLRVYALFRHGEREMERLVHPSSIGGSGQEARRLRRQGAYMAWIFFMLFAMSIAVCVAILALLGLSFEPSLVLTLAALTTTGQLATVSADVPLGFSALQAEAKVVLAFAMMLGRVETLALLAFVFPSGWRR